MENTTVGNPCSFSKVVFIIETYLLHQNNFKTLLGTNDAHQNGFASSLDTIEPQEEGRSVGIIFVLVGVDLNAFKDEGDAILRFIIHNVSHCHTVALDLELSFSIMCAARVT